MYYHNPTETFLTTRVLMIGMVDPPWPPLILYLAFLAVANFLGHRCPGVWWLKPDPDPWWSIFVLSTVPFMD